MNEDANVFTIGVFNALFKSKVILVLKHELSVMNQFSYAKPEKRFAFKYFSNDMN